MVTNIGAYNEIKEAAGPSTPTLSVHNIASIIVIMTNTCAHNKRNLGWGTVVFLDLLILSVCVCLVKSS